MADQTQRLEIATVRAEIGSNITYRFNNDAIDAGGIPTESGDIPNLKQVILQLQEDGAEKISFATTIYPTTAAGIAATTNGAIFLVRSADPDEIYAVYSNTAGVAVDTGKRALSATAIQTAMDAALESANAAEDSADLAKSRTDRFLAPSATDPELRDDGTTLQIGDRYVNTVDQAEYIYKTDGWALNDSLAAIADLEDGSDPAKGAALIPYDQTSAGEQILLSRKLSNYSALRAYTGSASHVELTQTGVSGQFAKLASGLQVDDGGLTIVDGLGRAFRRLFTGDVSSTWFGTAGDGVADDSDALQGFWTCLSKNGLSGRIPAGTYSISKEILTRLDSSFEVYADANANFIATSGFPSGGGMFKVGNSDNKNKTFKWVGGRFDGSKQPYSTEGSGSGCALISVNATNCTHCHVEIYRTYTGPNWMESGGDSHLFIGGPKNIFARIYESIGAPDNAIYISRNAAGADGECIDVDGNFYFCSVGVIVKRQFRTGTVKATVSDCITGACIGQADITGFASAGGGSGYRFEVNAKRTENPVFLQAVRAVQGSVNCDNLGVNIPAYTSALTGLPIAGYVSHGASAVRFRGASDCQFDVNVSGVTPGLVVTADFCGAYFGSISNAVDGTLQANNNIVNLKATGIGTPFVEGTAGTNNNFVHGKIDGLLSNSPAVLGVNTRYSLIVGGIELYTQERRMLDSLGRIIFSAGADGSVKTGAQSGAASSAYYDFFSAGLANRTARLIATGGTSASDSAALSIQAQQISLTTPAVDITGVLRPSVTGQGTVGSASRVFSTGFVVTAFTVTSDERYKEQISPIDDQCLDAWATVDYVKYKLKDAVLSKGDAARYHSGVIAQQVRDAFVAKGVDPFAYGVLCYDEWIDDTGVFDEEGNQVSTPIDAGSRYSIRYEEALVLEAALMRRATQRLEERIAALESVL